MKDITVNDSPTERLYAIRFDAQALPSSCTGKAPLIRKITKGINLFKSRSVDQWVVAAFIEECSLEYDRAIKAVGNSDKDVDSIDNEKKGQMGLF